MVSPDSVSMMPVVSAAAALFLPIGSVSARSTGGNYAHPGRPEPAPRVQGAQLARPRGPARSRTVITMRRVVGLLALAAVLASLLVWPRAHAEASGPDGYKWRYQNRLPNGHFLYATSGLSTSDVWGVGEYGAIMRWNGSALVEYASPTTNNLYGIYEQAANNVWAVGEGGVIIHFTGASWSTFSSPTSYDLWAISGYDANHIWAVGGYDGFHNAVVLYFNGAAWSVEQTYAEGSLYDVKALNATNIWAVGLGPSRGRTLYCTNGNAPVHTWTEVNTTAELMTVDASAANEVWSVAWDGTVYRSIDAGTSWTAVFKDYWPAGIDVYSPTSVWVVGWEGTIRYYNGTGWTYHTSQVNDLCDVIPFGTGWGQVYAVGDSRFIYYTGGTSWASRAGGYSGTFNGISACSQDVVYAVGTYVDGTYRNMQRSTDGGQFWSTVNPGTNSTLTAVCACDPDNVFAAGQSGVIARYDGAAWEVDNVGSRNWNGVDALAADDAWAAGNRGTVSHWNGTAWSTPTSLPIGNNALHSVSMAATNNVWACGAGSYVARYNGSSWSVSTVGAAGQTYYGICALDATHVWMVGTNGNIYFYNGSSWGQQASGVTSTLQSVSAADPEHVWAVGNGGVILFYDGSSWSRQASGLTTVTLNSVCAYDANNIWAVGEGGVILFADPPYVKYCSPSHAAPGTVVDVEVGGGYTHFTDGDPRLAMGEGVSVVPGSLRVIDNTRLVASVEVDPGAEAGPREVAVESGAEEMVPLPGGFTVGDEPSVASVQPAVARRGWAGEVKITGSATHFGPGSRLSLGAGVKVGAVRVTSGTQLFAEVSVSPDAAVGGRDAAVRTGAEDTLPLRGGFSVLPPPDVTGVSPASAPPGAAVTVTGSGFGPATGGGSPYVASVVKFGGVPARSYLSWEENRVVCRVPWDAGQGPVTVETCNGSSAPRGFTLTLPRWYLAEGSTAWGFHTEINVLNPNPWPVSVRPTFMTPGGRVTKPAISMPAMSVHTFDPASDYGIEEDFSAVIECLEGESIAVDRNMFWLGAGGAAADGHVSSGAAAPSTTWYFPEGSSAWGFECWLTVQNPGADPAECELTYMGEGAPPVIVNKKVPAGARRSFNIADDIGAADASIMVRSSVPVVAERSMYRNGRREGSNSLGNTGPSADSYLAEGSTAWGFTTYVLVQNPNPAPVDVTLTCMTPDGAVKRPPFTMPPESRQTIRINDIIGGSDVSVKVHGSLPVVAERAMYWKSVAGETCHASAGARAPHRLFYMPGGRAGAGLEGWFDTWTTVQNPDRADVKVRVSYLTGDGKGDVSFEETIPAGSRRSFRMGDRLESGQAGIVVECLTPGRSVVAERSSYWGTAPGSRTGGANTSGAFSD